MTPIEPWRFVATLAALAPCAVMAVVLLRMGRGAFSKRLAGVTLAAGAMIAVLPVATSFYLNAWAAWIGLAPLSQAAFQAFFEAGLFEEAAKALAIATFVHGHFARRTRLDFVLGSAMVALGFAAIENVAYVLRYQADWGWVAILRALTSAPIHALLGLTLGGFFARAEIAGKMRWSIVVIGWLAVAALHGSYDFPLMLSARMPLYPPEINALAKVASLEPWTLLSLGFVLAVAAILVSAILTMRAVGPQTGAPAPPARHDLAPRASQSPIREIGLPASLGLGSMFCLALAGDAYLGDAILWAPLQLSASALILATLAFLVRPALRPAPLRLSPGILLATTLVASGGVLVAPEIWSRARSGVFVNSGKNNLQLARVKEALNNFNVAVSEQPDNLRALVGRSECYLVLQQYAQGLADLDHAVTIAPNNAGLYAARGGMRRSMHYDELAFADFDHALSLAPNDPQLMVMRGEAHLALGRSDAAFVDAANAIAKNIRLPAAHMLRAAILEERNDENGALAALRFALAYDPKNPAAAFFRGRIQFKRRDYAAAAADFEIAIARGRREFMALWLFLARLRMGHDGVKVLAEWSRVLPKAAWPYPLVEFLIGQRDVPALLAEVKGVDRRCEANFYLGAWMVTQGDRHQARRYLRGAAEICPKGFIEKRAAESEIINLDLTETPEHPAPPKPSDLALARTPRPDSGAKPAPAPTAQVADLLADARRRLYADDFEKARAAIDRARGLEPDSVAPELAWAEYLAVARLDAVESIDALDRAIARDPGNAEAAFARGRLNYRLRRLRLAVVDLDFAATHSRNTLAPLWLFAAQNMLGVEGKSELAAARKKLPPGWPRPLYDLYLGEAAEDAALSQAQDAAQTCQAHFYTGLLLSAERPNLRAIGKMSHALQMCRRDWLEGEIAKTEMLTLAPRKFSQDRSAIPPWVRSP